MAFGYTPLVDSWHDSRQDRTQMPIGERALSIEALLGMCMNSGQPTGATRWTDIDSPRKNEPQRQP